MPIYTYPTGFSGSWSGTVSSGGSQNVSVTFAPSAAQSYGGTVTVNSDATSGTNTRSCSGTGVAPASTCIIRLTGDLSFGNVTVGQTATRTMTIYNDGNSALTVSSISYPSGFDGNWNSGSIAAGGSRTVTITFIPLAASSYGGSITVSSDASSGTNTIYCSGTGTTHVADPPNPPANLGPVQGYQKVSINVDLIWSSVDNATSYNIYLGTSPSLDSRDYIGNQTYCSFDPGTLDFNTTYYWRIDTVNANGTTRGSVWSFKTQQAPDPAVAAGNEHVAGLKIDGTVLAVGSNNSGQCNTGAWRDIIQIDAGSEHTVGLKEDGTVVATGDNYYGQCNVTGWYNMVFISAGEDYTAGLRGDGTVLCTGNCPALSSITGWSDVIMISAGGYHIFGIRADGSIVFAGSDGAGLFDFDAWTDIVQISSRFDHVVGLQRDNTLVSTGYCGNGGCDVNAWQDIIQVSTGLGFTIGLQRDGRVFATGSCWGGQCDVGAWEDITQVAAGYGSFTIGLQANGTVLFAGQSDSMNQELLNEWVLGETIISEEDDGHGGSSGGSCFVVTAFRTHAQHSSFFVLLLLGTVMLGVARLVRKSKKSS